MQNGAELFVDAAARLAVHDLLQGLRTGGWQGIGQRPGALVACLALGVGQAVAGDGEEPGAERIAGKADRYRKQYKNDRFVGEGGAGKHDRQNECQPAKQGGQHSAPQPKRAPILR